LASDAGVRRRVFPVGRLTLLKFLIAGLTATVATAATSAELTDPVPEMSPVLVADLRASTQAVRLARFDSNPGISVDGRLDEPVWQALDPIGEFHVVEPDLLIPPHYATEVRLLYTPNGLYVGISMEQPKETLVAQLSSRDQRDLNRDSVTIMIDTSGEGRYGYYFGVNLGNSLDDGTLLPERQLQGDWDGPWYGASARTETGWSAEMFLPWSMFSMPSRGAERTLGIYVERRVAHLDELWSWPALPETRPRFISSFAPVRVLDVSPRQQYSLFPYVSASHDGINHNQTYKTGLDLFWRPTSDFQLMGTINPDFGNVESDEVVVSLDAFETFFSEKRLFFLEGQEIFVTSPRETPTPVNTRRIGGTARMPENPDGAEIPVMQRNQPVELLGALKAAGEAGPFRYGVMAAFEDDVEFAASLEGERVRLQQDGSDYGVFRVLYEDNVGGAYRGVGWISTAVVHPERDAFVHGVDLHYLSADARYKFDGQVLTSDVDDQRTGAGGFFDLEYNPGAGVRHRFGMEYFDKHIDLNDLGFLRRNDYLRVEYDGRRSRANRGNLRNLEERLRMMAQVNSADELTSSGVWLDWTLTTQNLARIRPSVSYYPARYDDRNSRGRGSYRIEGRWNAGIGLDTDSARPVSMNVDLDYNQMDLGGDSFRARARVRARPSDRFSLEVEVPYTTRNGWLLYQRDRDFATFSAEEWRPSLAMDYFLTARQQLRFSFQWVGIKAHEQRRFRVPESPGDLIEFTPEPEAESDSFSISRMNLQLRYRWELAPLSDLFLVYTRAADERGSADQRFGKLARNSFDDPVQDQLVMKLRYRFGS
jgi:hypothetical protein